MGEALRVLHENASEVVAENRKEICAVQFVAEIRKWFPGLGKLLARDERKAAPILHYLIGGDAIAKVRTCYDWCAGRFDPPAIVIIKLLRSSIGWTVLEYLMRGCKEPWWLEMLEHRRKAEILDRAIQDAQGSLPLER